MQRISSLALTVALLSTVAVVSSAAFAANGPVAVEPAATPFTIGTYKAFVLRDAQFVTANDGMLYGADASTDEVGKVLKAAGAPTDSITLGVDVLLVEIGQRRVLLDTGLGPQAKGVLLQSLAKTGVSPDAITDILITHSHGDHIGGLLGPDGATAFAKATVRMASAEWTYLQGQKEMAALVKAVTTQVQTFEPGAQPVPGITAVPINGHTPGHMAYEIVSGHAKLLDIGDSAHSSILSLAKPTWTMQFDGDKAVAKASRIKLLHDLAMSHEQIFAPHFPYPGVGTVAGSGDHFTWRPTLKAAP